MANRGERLLQQGRQSQGKRYYLKKKKMLKPRGKCRQRKKVEGNDEVGLPRWERAEVEDPGGGDAGRPSTVLTGFYVRRSQLSSGSKVNPDEFSLGVDGTKNEGTRQKGQNGDPNLNSTQNALKDFGSVNGLFGVSGERMFIPHTTHG